MTNTVEKKTQAQMFAEIRDFLRATEGKEEWIQFLDNRMELLAAQAAKAKERKAKKAKPEDELLAAVAAQIGEKLKTGDEIVAALQGKFPEISRAKVVARLKVLVDQGVIGKISVKTGPGKRTMAYALKEFMPVEDED